MTVNSGSDADFIKQVAVSVNDFMSEFQLEQQVRARDNAFTRDVAQNNKRLYMQDFEIGSTVSLNGESVVVVKLEGWDGMNHMVAHVRNAAQPEGKIMKVRSEDLRERCWGQPQWHPVLACKYLEGDFVFIDSEQSQDYQAGMILQVTADEIVVHEWMPNAKRTRWAPCFENDKGKVVCVNKQPNGTQPKTLSIMPSDILVSGKLKGTVLSDDTRRRLNAKGYMWALPK